MKNKSELNIYSYKSYRKFINAWIEVQERPRGLMRKLGEVARCETSHVSRVLSGQLEFTMDQAFRIIKFINLRELEQKYFLKLVEFERSGDSDYRKLLENDLKEMIESQQNLAKRFQETTVMTEGRELFYYSSWHWSAIHIIVSIPEYQTATAISKKLGLEENFVQVCLVTLENFGLIKNENDRWKMTNKHIHLSKNSPMNSVQHSNWRQRAVLKTQDPDHKGLHYTVVQSLSREDYEKLRDLWLDTLDKYRATANPSKEEELVCLTLDFFKI